MTVVPGTRLGPYEILSPLGAGGMGEVYRAKDPRLNREVAIKVLPEDFLDGEEGRKKFEREARLLEGATLREKLDAGPIQHKLARIYILVGEQEKALDQLEPLLKVPYVLTLGWLQIDPNFDPLRKNPRFQKLVAGE